MTEFRASSNNTVEWTAGSHSPAAAAHCARYAACALLGLRNVVNTSFVCVSERLAAFSTFRE